MTFDLWGRGVLLEGCLSCRELIRESSATTWWLLASAVLALRGSLRAYLVWLGVVAFTVYSYVIYAFSVPFGPLFPLWAAVLGISLFSLIGGLHDVDADAAARRFTSSRTVRVSAWFLLVVAGLFALLWLSEDVPALLAGSSPPSVVDMALPTNPSTSSTMCSSCLPRSSRESGFFVAPTSPSCPLPRSWFSWP